MKVFELRLKVYLLKDIHMNNSLGCIASLIDKCLLTSEEMADFHRENRFKLYSFNSLFPLEDDLIFKAGKIYTIQLRTVDENLANYFNNNLADISNDEIKALTIDLSCVYDNFIKNIYSVTTVVLKFEEGYWKEADITLDEYENRLKVNLIKKYKSITGVENIDENFELFTSIEFKNKYPISFHIKDVALLGDKIKLNVASNNIAQELAKVALGTGIGEMGSRGAGFCNYK